VDAIPVTLSTVSKNTDHNHLT